MQDCQRALKPLLKTFSEIEDLIIFGSLAKSASAPNDIDVAAIFLIPPDRDLLRKIKGELERIDARIELQAVTVRQLYDPLWIALIREGFSVKKGEFLHTLHKIKPVILYNYTLTKLSPSKKVLFTRGMDAIAKEMKIEKLTRSVVLVPFEKKQAFEEFLQTWNLTYEARSYELLPLLRKEA